jgi:exopolysaccharide biosynthesis polyprenyl glycosylphosphotransferase
LHSDLFSVRLTRAVAEQLDETPILSLYTNKEHSWGFVCKRVMDVVGAAVLLLLCAPLLLLIAALIKLTSPGPVFFAQERLGYNKRLFRIFKFRTMVANAPELQAQLEHLNEVGGPVFKIKDDPRVTPLGKFLRKTSLDELPQLFNVLLGDLSLVGPRPLPRRDYDRFEKYWFNRRFSVKPGITCIWQVSGRSNTDFDHWIRQDLEYIDQWSLALDVKILLKTIPAVWRGTGAM